MLMRGVPVIMLAFAQHYTVEHSFANTPQIKTSTVMRTLHVAPNVSYALVWMNSQNIS